MKEYPKNAVYNKLIRDKVADQVREKTGLDVVTKKVTKEEAIELLKLKIREEVEEIEEAETIEEVKSEIADILEAVFALTREYEFDLDEIEGIRAQKAEKRGAYKERLYLIETKERV